MAQNNNWLLYLGLAGIGYYLWKQSQAAAVPVTSSTTSPVTAAPILPVSAPTLQTGTSASLVVPVSTSSSSTPNGIDPTVYATVQQWALSIPNAPGVMQFFNAAVPSEFQTIYGLITHDWPTCGGSCDSTSEAAWNQIVSKYGGITAGW